LTDASISLRRSETNDALCGLSVGRGGSAVPGMRLSACFPIAKLAGHRSDPSFRTSARGSTSLQFAKHAKPAVKQRSHQNNDDEDAKYSLAATALPPSLNWRLCHASPPEPCSSVISGETRRPLRAASHHRYGSALQVQRYDSRYGVLFLKITLAGWSRAVKENCGPAVCAPCRSDADQAR
jgi:hypothetical protein